MIFTIAMLSIDCVYASTYYISNNGNDTNDGLTTLTPFQSLMHLSTVIFVPGDSILFEAGHQFNGSFQVAMNTSLIKKLYFGIYNGTQKAVISGGIVPSNWSVSGGIASTLVSDEVHSVFVNNQRQISARFPDTGYLPITTVFGTNGFSSTALTEASSYWNGASVHLRSTPNQFETSPIAVYDNGSIAYASSINYTPAVGNGFYIDSSIQALNSSKEWFFESGNSTLHFIPQNISDLNNGVVAVVDDFGIQFMSACDSITIENIEFTYQAKSSIYFTSSVSNTKIHNCAFSFGNDAAIKSDGVATKVEIAFNDINDFLTNGIHLFQMWYSNIHHNQINNIGLIAGQGRNGYYQYTPVFSGFTAYCDLTDNVIQSFGNSAFKTDGPYNNYRRNYIKDGLQCLSSSGALNFYGEICKFLNIEDNIILNIPGNQDALAQKDQLVCGILMNGFCHNNSIRHNTIAHCGSYGLWITTGNYEHNISNNLMYNNGIAQLSLNDFYGTPGSNQNHSIRQNIFYNLSDKQACMEYETFNFENIYSETDSNYFCNPYNYIAVREKFVLEEPALIEYRFPDWKKLTLNDSNSVASRLVLNHYEVENELEPELITNGNFTNNFDDWQLFSEDGTQMLLDNEIGMDGGCMKLVVDDTSLLFAQFNSKPFVIQSNQYYRLRYSVFGNNTSYMRSSVYQNSGDYLPVGLDRYITYNNTRTERELIFKSNEECPSCAVRFAIFQGDSLLVMDNISLKKISVTALDSTKTNRLIVNYSSQPLVVNLHDTIFLDLDGNSVSGTYTLPPYGSYVLVPQQVVYNKIERLNTVSNSISIFPNPAHEFIFLLQDNILNSASTIEIVNANGQIVKTLSTTLSTAQRIEISDIPEGFFILRVINEGGVVTTRFIKM